MGCTLPRVHPHVPPRISTAVHAVPGCACSRGPLPPWYLSLVPPASGLRPPAIVNNMLYIRTRLGLVSSNIQTINQG